MPIKINKLFIKKITKIIIKKILLQILKWNKFKSKNFKAKSNKPIKKSTFLTQKLKFATKKSKPSNNSKHKSIHKNTKVSIAY